VSSSSGILSLGDSDMVFGGSEKQGVESTEQERNEKRGHDKDSRSLGRVLAAMTIDGKE
jgi:hypothetical protein